MLFEFIWQFSISQKRYMNQLKLIFWHCGSRRVRVFFQFGLALLARHMIGLRNSRHSRPIRSKTKTNRASLAHVFPRYVSAICNYFEFWLVHWIICPLWLVRVIMVFIFTTLDISPRFFRIDNILFRQIITSAKVLHDFICTQGRYKYIPSVWSSEDSSFKWSAITLLSDWIVC